MNFDAPDFHVPSPNLADVMYDSNVVEFNNALVLDTQ